MTATTSTVALTNYHGVPIPCRSAIQLRLMPWHDGGHDLGLARRSPALAPHRGGSRDHLGLRHRSPSGASGHDWLQSLSRHGDPVRARHINPVDHLPVIHPLPTTAPPPEAADTAPTQPTHHRSDHVVKHATASTATRPRIFAGHALTSPPLPCCSPASLSRWAPDATWPSEPANTSALPSQKPGRAPGAGRGPRGPRLRRGVLRLVGPCVDPATDHEPSPGWGVERGNAVMCP